MRHRSISAFLFIAILFVSAYWTPVHAYSAWGKVSDSEWTAGPPAAYPDANAAVVYDVCSLKVMVEQIEMTRHVRYKLFNKKGAEDVGTISIDYDEDDALKDLKAQTISPGGKATKVDGKEIHTKSDGSNRSAVFTFPAADSGCILEYSYRNVNQRYTYMDPWYFQCGLYTFASSFTLILGPGFTYVTAFSNVPSAERSGVQGELPNPANFQFKLRTFTWTRTKLVPVVEEPFMGAEIDYLSSLNHQLVSLVDAYNNIHFIKNWQDMGVEYQKWLDEFFVGKGLDEIVAKTCVGATTDLDKAHKLYDYVTTGIVTRSGDFSGNKPNETVGDVLKSGSGTGQDKNLLLCALLNKAGIKAWPVLISTRDHRHFNPEIYQVQQFNYKLAFAQFDSSVIYMDTRNKYCPFGMLPPSCLVDGGFLIDGKNSQLVKVLRTEPRSYRYDMTDVTIDSLGQARCSTLCSFSGYYAPTYGSLYDANTPEEFVKKYFTDKIDENAVLGEHNFTVDSLGRCQMSAIYTLKNLVRQVENDLVLQPISFRFRENPFTKEKRYFPIDFEYAQTYHNVMVIHSDRPITASSLPAEINLQVDGGSYLRACTIDNGVVRIDAKLVLSKPIYAPNQYFDIRKLFDAVGKAQQDNIVLTTGS